MLIDITYLFRSQKCHSNGDPAPLAGTEHKGLFDTEGIQNLQIHLCGIPIGPVLALGACLAMAKQLYGQKIHGVGQRLVFILLLVEFR